MERVEAFFDRFVKAFATFDAATVAELFATPGVALRRDGSIVALTTRDDVLRYYGAALERYRSDGCASCTWSGLETTRMGQGSALATVTWRLHRANGSVLTSWRQSYCISLTGPEPRIYASAMH